MATGDTPKSPSAWPAFLAGLSLIFVFGGAAYAVRDPLARGFQKVWPVKEKVVEPPATLPTSLTHRPEKKSPARVWAVGEISTAVTTLPGEIEALVLEGHQELRQLTDPGALVDPAAQQRARMFFQTWGRTFRNRINLLEQKTPPNEACAAYSSMVKGCREIHIAFDGLRRATNMTTIPAARKTLDTVVEELKKALAPPVDPAAVPPQP